MIRLDPVLAEIREVREAYSERFKGNVRAMLADLRSREGVAGRTVVSLPAKRIQANTEPVGSSQ